MAEHSGTSPVRAQNLVDLLANFEFDPFVAQQQAEHGGNLLAHYPAPLVDSGDVFMLFKTGFWTACSPPGSGQPAPCGSNAWQSQIWNIKRLGWQRGQLVEQWNFESDWKPEPDRGGLSGWEPVFHAALAGDFLYVPGARGSVFRVNRSDGTVSAESIRLPTPTPMSPARSRWTRRATSTTTPSNSMKPRRGPPMSPAPGLSK